MRASSPWTRALVALGLGTGLTLTPITPASAGPLGGAVLPLLGDAAADAPAITAVEPAELKAGAKVTVRGSGFVDGDLLRLDGKDLEGVEVSGDRISGTIPATTKKGKKLTVVRAKKTVAQSAEFTFVPPPTLSSVKPTFGVPGGSVTIKGKNLDRIDAVEIGGKAQTIAEKSATSITVTVVDGTQTGPLTVRGFAGEAALKKEYEIFYPPTLSAATPGALFEGDALTITGAHLGGTGKAAVKFSLGKKKLKVTEVADAKAVVEVVKGAKTGALSAEARKQKAELGGEITVHPTPVISSAPKEVGAPGVLKISGKNLDAVETWRLGQVTLTPDPAAKNTATKIALQVPAEAGGEASVDAEAFGRHFASKKGVAVIKSPVIVALGWHDAKKGIEGEVRGRDFTSKTKLKIAGKAAKVAFIDEGRLTFTMTKAPAGAGAAIAANGKFSGPDFAVDGGADGFRHRDEDLDGLLASPPADYTPAMASVDVAQSRASTTETADELRALGEKAGDKKGAAAADEVGLRLAYDLKRMVLIQRSMCAAMTPGKTKGAANKDAGVALRDASDRTREIMASLTALWSGLPADALVRAEGKGVAVDQMDVNVAAALAAQSKVAAACAGRFFGDKILTDAGKISAVDVSRLYDRAIVAAFGRVLATGKTWPEVEAAVNERLKTFASARAAYWKKVLQADKKGVEATTTATTGKGARGDKKVDKQGKPAGNTGKGKGKG
ncbi:MAG: IPT/TIG domain-containing protein [Nannocystaceae bacterium]